MERQSSPVDNVILVIKTVMSSNEPLNTRQIERRTGLNRRTVQRHCDTLSSAEMLIKSKKDTFGGSVYEFNKSAFVGAKELI